MSIIYFLIPLSIVLALLGLIGYIWSVKSGQFQDMETPAMRMLSDDEEIPADKD